MGQVLKTYLGLFFLLIMGLVGIGVVAAGIEVTAARNYHADVISQVECSNFNAGVISACKNQAGERGYQLEVAELVYDVEGNQRMAEIILSFEYSIPIPPVPLILFPMHCLVVQYIFLSQYLTSHFSSCSYMIILSK